MSPLPDDEPKLERRREKINKLYSSGKIRRRYSHHVGAVDLGLEEVLKMRKRSLMTSLNKESIDKFENFVKIVSITSWCIINKSKDEIERSIECLEALGINFFERGGGIRKGFPLIVKEDIEDNEIEVEKYARYYPILNIEIKIKDSEIRLTTKDLPIFIINEELLNREEIWILVVHEFAHALDVAAPLGLEKKYDYYKSNLFADFLAISVAGAPYLAVLVAVGDKERPDISKHRHLSWNHRIFLVKEFGEEILDDKVGILQDLLNKWEKEIEYEAAPSISPKLVRDVKDKIEWYFKGSKVHLFNDDDWEELTRNFDLEDPEGEPIVLIGALADNLMPIEGEINTEKVVDSILGWMMKRI